MKNSGLIWITLLVVLLAACDSGSQRSLKREALEEEMRNRQPKKLSEAQITAEAFRQGRQIADSAQQALLGRLQQAIHQGNITDALQYCNIQALPLTDSLSQHYNATIRRSSLKARNQVNKSSQLEEQLLEAYEYNAQERLPLEDNVQRIDHQYLLYTKPIVIGSELCLNCHGTAGEEIAGQTLQLIDSLYPNDRARDYDLGDFRGIWSIHLQQKELVNAL